MNDAQFLQHFEAATLHPFHHAEHIRMAWLYLRRAGWSQGYSLIQSGIRRMAEQHHARRLYHETITRFWALMVLAAIDARPDIVDFAGFQQAHPQLFDKTLIAQYYSRDLLDSEDARRAWAAPDLRDLA